jgi:TonB-dependent receptor-like protein
MRSTWGFFLALCASGAGSRTGAAAMSAQVSEISVDTSFTRDSLATFRGIVTDSAGTPVSLASIVIDGDMVTTYSRGDGAFGPIAIPPGHHRIVAGSGGYRMLGADFNIVAKATAKFAIKLVPDGTRLPAVHVVGDRDLFPSDEPGFSGFEHRREVGTGRYLDAQQISARSNPPVSELLRDVAGVTLHPVSTTAGTTAYRVEMRGAVGLKGICTSPALFLDGEQVELAAGDANALDDLVRSRDIAGIEVYPGASSLPPQFNFGGASCGALVIWTKDSVRP